MRSIRRLRREIALLFLFKLVALAGLTWLFHRPGMRMPVTPDGVAIHFSGDAPAETLP